MAGGTGGSQRWLSPHHSQAYRDIFEGRWEDWDPYKAGPRMRAAEQAVCSWGGDGEGGSPGSAIVRGGGRETPQPFRPFQGFLSFGRWGEVGNVSGRCVSFEVVALIGGVVAAVVVVSRWLWLSEVCFLVLFSPRRRSYRSTPWLLSCAGGRPRSPRCCRINPFYHFYHMPPYG